MKPEDIKVGETYYVRVKVDSMDVDAACCLLIDESGKGNRVQKFYKWMLYAFSPAPSKPKYDPCRPFKEHDVVRFRKSNGRFPKELSFLIDTTGTAFLGEFYSGKVRVVCDDGEHRNIDAHYLELVTPVEELEPFFVFEDATSWQVKKGNSLCARYGKATHPHAKEAAEAECARLNEEYRKEQSNG